MRTRPIALRVGSCLLAGVVASSCSGFAKQLPPTELDALDPGADRDAREQFYSEHQIYRHRQAQGVRYSKGNHVGAEQRSWHSLDDVLRANPHSATALPTRQLRRSRVFAALTIAAGILTVAGASASAREGFSFGDITPAGGLMLGGGIATIGFGIASGVFYGKAQRGYDRAVDVYNDSLGMRLGILDASGAYIPPPGSLVDPEGNVLMVPEGSPPIRLEPSGAPRPQTQPSGEQKQPDPEPEPSGGEPATDPPSLSTPSSEVEREPVPTPKPEPLALSLREP